MNAKTVLKYASDQGAKFVSVRFTDLPGSWQHLTFPIAELGEDQFEDGFGFDASSIRGWAAIHESDMLLVPDAGRFWMDPFAEQPTLCLIGNALDPITKEGYAFDPRSVAVRAENYLKFTGLGDTAFFGPEAEFFVFDSAKFHNEQHSAGYSIDSYEGHWNSGRDANEFQGSNLGYRIRPKEGYVPVPPTDTLSDLRSEISLTLAKCGVTVLDHVAEHGPDMHPRWWTDPSPADSPPARLRRVVLRTPMLATAVEFFGGILQGEIEHESGQRVDLVWPRGARIGLEQRPDAPPGIDRLEVEGLAEEHTTIGTRFVPA